MKDEGDVLMLTHPRLDRLPRLDMFTVLNILEPLTAFARDPDEERITIVPPGGDKGMYELLSSMTGER